MRLSRCVTVRHLIAYKTSWFQVWRCSPNGLELLNTIECTHGAVLSLVAREDVLYAGCQDGYVRVWDLQTNTFIRTIIVQEVIPLSRYLFSLCAHLRA